MTHQDVAGGDVLAELLDQIRTTSSSMLLTTTGPTIPSRATLRLPRAAQYVLPDAVTMGATSLSHSIYATPPPFGEDGGQPELDRESWVSPPHSAQ